MPNPEVKVLEVNPAERENVVDALVRPWKDFTEPSRDDNEPFRRGDIRVKKVTLAGFSYDIFVCVPRDICWAPKIDVKKEGERVSLASAYLDKKASPLLWSFMSIKVNKGTILAATKGIYPHDYEHGREPSVAMPDVEWFPNIVIPSKVGWALEGCSINSITIMSGFRRVSTATGGEASIAVFTKPIVK